MRILYIIPQLGASGAEVLLIDIIYELIKQKKEVFLVCLKEHHPTHTKIKNVQFVFDNIKVEVITDYYTKIKMNGLSIKIPRLNEIIHQFEPDIIHSHLFLSELYSRSIIYSKAKWFSHFHDNMIQFENLSLKTIFDKSLFTNFIEKTYLFNQYKKNGGNHFIAISNDTYQFAKKTCKKYPVTKLENAINTERFKRNIPHQFDKIRIINIGTFVEKKNQSFFIDIAKELLKYTSNFEITLLGDGVLKPKVLKLIEKNNLENFFITPGSVSNVEEYLNHSNIYVHTAKYEPFGLVLVEAMAAELPVITLNGKGNKDLIIEGENGYMIDDANPSIFVDKVLKLWQDKRLYEKISSSAKLFSLNYDIKIYVSKLIEIYNR